MRLAVLHVISTWNLASKFRAVAYKVAKTLGVYFFAHSIYCIYEFQLLFHGDKCIYIACWFVIMLKQQTKPSLSTYNGYNFYS